MKITVLGCWSPFPRSDGACSGYLFQEQNTCFLLDCGHGIFSKLQKYGVYHNLDALIVSHLHPDHSADIHCLRHATANAIKQGKRKDRLRVYLPFSPALEFEAIKRCEDAFEFFDLARIPQFQIGPVEVKPFLTEHVMPTYGVSIITEKTKVVYTADTGWFELLPSIVQEANILICEASLREKDKAHAHVGHLTALQAGNLGREGRVGQLVITHLYPEYDLVLVKQEAEEGFQRNVVVSQEGLVIR